jgi:hypothetical protein
MTTSYVDGIANITMIDGIVRFDLVNITHIEKEKADVRPSGSLAMSLPALLRTYEQLTMADNKMVEDGILKKNDMPQNFANGLKPGN